MSDDKFKRDLEKNSYVSPFRKKRWALFFLRKEQAASNRFLKKLFALGKKVSLSGTCCELPASALLGGGLVIAHLNGIVVAPQSRVGEDCVFYQQVTLGINGRKSLEMGPQVGDRVSFGAGSKVIGPVRIGDDVEIGANAVVTKDVPAGSTVVGFNRLI